MKRIRGEAKNLRGLLVHARFDIDYYQREYRWGPAGLVREAGATDLERRGDSQGAVES